MITSWPVPGGSAPSGISYKSLRYANYDGGCYCNKKTYSSYSNPCAMQTTAAAHLHGQFIPNRRGGWYIYS